MVNGQWLILNEEGPLEDSLREKGPFGLSASLRDRLRLREKGIETKFFCPLFPVLFSLFSTPFSYFFPAKISWPIFSFLVIR